MPHDHAYYWKPIFEEGHPLPSGDDQEFVLGMLISKLSTGYQTSNLRSVHETCRHAVLRSAPRSANHQLLQLLVGERTDEEAWLDALASLRDLDTTYGWGSKQRKAKHQHLLRKPGFLEALQATTVITETVPLSFLAVLVTDGGEDSVDALLPHHQRAKADDGLLLLKRLKTHTKPGSPAEDFLQRVQRDLRERETNSPALALSETMGCGPRETFWFEVHLHSDELRDAYNTALRLVVRVDSRRSPWVSLYAQMDRRTQKLDALPGTLHGTRFSSAQTLPEDIKALFANHDLTPSPSRSWTRSCVRGKARDRITEWLLSG